MGWIIRRARCRAGAEDGFTLVEMLVAAGIGALAFAAVFAGIQGGLAGIASGRAASQATSLVRGAVETARAVGWEQLAHAPGAVAGDPDVDTCAGVPCYRGEHVIEDPGGALDPYIRAVPLGGFTFDVRTYVTWADLTPASAVRRVSAVVRWEERGRTRSLTSSTLVHPVAEDVGAAAFVLDGNLAGESVGPVAWVEASTSGGSESESAASFAPVPGVSGTGGSASAAVLPGPTGHAQAAAATLTIGLGGLSISAAGVQVSATSQPGSLSASAEGTVTVNGEPYVNPPPGTVVSVPGWKVYLNDQRIESDGVSVAFLRIVSTLNNDELTAVWAWVQPAEVLGG